MDNEQRISVEVAYALPDKQVIIPLQVPAGTSVYDAAVRSGITDQFPQIELDSDPMGIFGKIVRKPKEQALQAGERVEIYRPLLADPKVVRAKRADKVKQQQVATKKAQQE